MNLQTVPALSPAASTTGPTHLEKQQVQLGERMADLKAALADTENELADAVPAATGHLRAMGTAFKSLCAVRAEEVAAEAFRESAWKCVSLKPLAASKPNARLNAQVLAWLAVAAAGLATLFILQGWGLVGMIVGVGVAAMLYRHFLGLARKQYAHAASADALARLGALAGLDLKLVHLAGTPSGHKDFPYTSVEVDGGAGAANSYLDRGRRFDVAQFGDLYGATLCGFVPAGSSADPDMWLVLGDDTQTLRRLDVAAVRKGSPDFVDVAAPLLALAAQHGPALVGTITVLSEKVARRRGAQSELALLESRLRSLASQEAAWRNVAINRSALDAIVIHIELFKMGKAGAPKGILLYGPPGTGKTSIARNLAATSGCHFMTVDLASLKGQFQGQTAPAVVDAWTRARAKAPCILFVDECESIFGTRSERGAGGHNINFDNELVETFLQQWDGINSSSGQVFVVGATNRHENIDTAIASRFNKMIEIGLPDLEARQQILTLEFSQRGINLPVTQQMAKETAGMSGRDLSTLATSFQGATLMTSPSAELFTATLKEARGKSSTLTDGVRWDQVILESAFKAKLEGLARKIKRAEEYLKAGFEIPKSLLLYGPPGTGKTQIARALATESGIAFQAVTTADIKGVSLGESGKQVKRVFEMARAQAPCLLFIDEIDIITGSRGQSDRASTEIVGQLLQEMDGIKSRAGSGFVFVLAATNAREDMDQAVLSRFGEQEEVGLPDAQARAAILAVLLQGKPLAFALEPALLRLADATDGFSGRDLGTLVKAAAGRAMQRADDEGLEIEDIRIQEDDFAAHSIGKRAIRAA